MCINTAYIHIHVYTREKRVYIFFDNGTENDGPKFKRCLREGARKAAHVCIIVFNLYWGVSAEESCCTSGLRESSTLPMFAFSNSNYQVRTISRRTLNAATDSTHEYRNTRLVTRYHTRCLFFRRHPPPGGRSLWKNTSCQREEYSVCGYTVVCNNAFGFCCALRRVGLYEGHILYIFYDDGRA